MGQVIKVFLASPGDVLEERVAVCAIIEEENRNNFNHAGYNLEVVGWETHASPGKGQPHPQGRINPLIDDCELFIGILWARFGLSFKDKFAPWRPRMEGSFQGRRLH